MTAAGAGTSVIVVERNLVERGDCAYVAAGERCNDRVKDGPTGRHDDGCATRGDFESVEMVACGGTEIAGGTNGRSRERTSAGEIAGGGAGGRR